MSMGTTDPKKEGRTIVPEEVEDAKETKGSVRKALDKQLGRGTKTGGRLGDATCQINDGINDVPPSKK